MSISNSYHYPKPSEEGLKLQYVGKKLSELPTPAAVIDVAAVRRNCDAMLAAIEDISMLDFRAHVKTHKTAELTELQVNGHDPKRNRHVKLVVSTVAEIEHLLPWLLEKKRKSTAIDILYGVPASPSSLSRLAALAHILGQSSISLLVDNADSIEIIANSRHLWPGIIQVFIKIDTGYHRCGVEPDSEAFLQVSSQLKAHKDNVQLRGIYSHLGNSYGFNAVEEAIHGLQVEIEKLHQVGKYLSREFPNLFHSFIYSVGATPTATAAQNLTGESKAAQDFRRALATARDEFRQHRRHLQLTIELHAGVYPLLDLQQLATHARPGLIRFYKLSSEPGHNYQGLSNAAMGLRILVEVASLYPHRKNPEALIAAGSLALGREPCKSYSGWGVVSPWSESDPQDSWYRSYDRWPGFYDPDQPEPLRSGWVVSRISQEHGMLTWEGPKEEKRELKLGEKLLIWPNHACIAGAGFGWYFVVDTDSEDTSVVKDVWVRCRGW
jgi:D-serine deaminase-like pyridoxal phosphate-dependent protein